MPRWQPNWEQVFSEEWYPANSKWILPATGYLLAVYIRESDQTNWPDHTDTSYKAIFEITDPSGTYSRGDFSWDYTLYGCGIAFKEPLPNMDGRGSYMLKRIHPTIDELPLKVVITSLGTTY